MNKTIYALGFFDGVHLGHAALLEACRRLAQETGARSGVVTFVSHPDTLVLGKTPGLITAPADRERILREQFHMDWVVALPFDESMRSRPWESFLSMLETEYGAAGFVCGEDFRFGHKGLGNASLLEDYCKRSGIPCAIVPEQTVDGIRVSSSHIRALLEAGQMEEAVRFLGHPYLLTYALSRRHQYRHPTHGGRPAHHGRALDSGLLRRSVRAGNHPGVLRIPSSRGKIPHPGSIEGRNPPQCRPDQGNPGCPGINFPILLSNLKLSPLVLYRKISYNDLQ